MKRFKNSIYMLRNDFSGTIVYSQTPKSGRVDRSNPEKTSKSHQIIDFCDEPLTPSPPLSRLHGKKLDDPATKNMLFVLPSVHKACGNRLETIFEQIKKRIFYDLGHFFDTLSMYLL